MGATLGEPTNEIEELMDAYGFDEEYHRSLMLPQPEPVDEGILDQIFEEVVE